MACLKLLSGGSFTTAVETKTSQFLAQEAVKSGWQLLTVI